MGLASRSLCLPSSFCSDPSRSLGTRIFSSCEGSCPITKHSRISHSSIDSSRKPSLIITTLPCLVPLIPNGLWEIVRFVWKPFWSTHHFQVAPHQLTWKIDAPRKDSQPLYLRAAGRMLRLYSAELWSCSKHQRQGRITVSHLVVTFSWVVVLIYAWLLAHCFVSIRNV